MMTITMKIIPIMAIAHIFIVLSFGWAFIGEIRISSGTPIPIMDFIIIMDGTPAIIGAIPTIGPTGTAELLSKKVS